jgi:hypothetical protein
VRQIEIQNTLEELKLKLSINYKQDWFRSDSKAGIGMVNRGAIGLVTMKINGIINSNNQN